ncbi:MAG: bifunctional oligoribonuclease/PAP phosphatase NrnA [Eubacteriales bacterium]|jgi:phosphoesterase RecJ-like protein
MSLGNIRDYLDGVKTVAIAGHVNPDGDCVGSTMGMMLYLKSNFPEIRADVYLENLRDEFRFIEDSDKIRMELDEVKPYDLIILLDISSRDRIGVIQPLLPLAGKILCFDHHVTNKESYTWLWNYPEMSSTSEVIYHYMEPDLISEKCAEALYMGIAHDTGIFQYSSTSPTTMRVAANLMEKGIPFSKIVDDTYYQKTYVQNQIMGRTIMESILVFDGKLIIGYVKNKDMAFYGVGPKDMDGIVNSLRNTIGVEVAIFMYEKEPSIWKVSLRSKSYVDVSAVAEKFQGGGHVRAAGCTMNGSQYDVINNLTCYLEKDLAPKEQQE